MAESGTKTTSRLVWVDAARGVSVLLVVLLHISIWHICQYQEDLQGHADLIWAKFNAVSGSVRMPLLLGLSGLVTSHRIHEGIRDRKNAARAAANYYLFVVWLMIYFIFFTVVSTPVLPHRIDGITDLMRQLFVPDTTLWFIYALALYAVVLPALHRIPGALQLLFFALMSIAARSVGIEASMALKTAENAIFFVVGIHAAPLIRRLAERATVPRLVVAAVIAAVVTLGGRLMNGDVLGSVLFMTRGLTFGVVAVLGIAVAVRWRPAGSALSAIGRHTLPIYVLHPLIIYSVMALTPDSPGLSAMLSTPVGALLYPLGLMSIIAAVSLSLHRLLIFSGLGFFFEMPTSWRGRILAYGVPSSDGRSDEIRDTGLTLGEKM